VKNYLILSIILTFSYNYCHAQSDFNPKDSTVIYGKVIDFNPQRNDKLISFRVNDIRGQKKIQSVAVNKDGYYRLAFFRPFDSELQVNYNGEAFLIYSSSKQKLLLNFYPNAPTAYVLAGGKSALSSMSNLVTEYQMEFSEHEFKKVASLGDKSISDSLFSIDRKAQLLEELDFNSAFNKKHHVTAGRFISWQKNNVIYKAAYDIVFNPFYGKHNKTIDFQDLLGYLNGIELNNKDAELSGKYYEFAEMFASSAGIIFHLNPKHTAQKLKYGNDVLPIYLEKADALLSGNFKQLAIYNFSVANIDKIKFLDSVHRKKMNLIENSFLKKDLESRLSIDYTAFRSYDVIEKIRGLKFPDTLKKDIIKIFEQNADKNIYLDFWGDWCGPCMAEMPHYKKLLDKLEPNKISMVFISADTKDESVKRVKEKFSINAAFYNLSKDEIALLQNAFDFTSFPNHFLVKSGKVISKGFHLQSQNIDLLSKEITEKFNMGL